MVAADGAHLRERLVTAALDALERGEEVGLRAVARAAGVSAMAPYRHFADKAALLLAVAGDGFDRLRDRLLTADAAGEARAALLAQAEAYVAFARAHPTLFRLMFSGLPLVAPKAEGDEASAYRVLVRRVQTLAPPDRVEAATLACWAAVHGLATLSLDNNVRRDPAAERAALALIIDAIAAG